MHVLPRSASRHGTEILLSGKPHALGRECETITDVATVNALEIRCSSSRSILSHAGSTIKEKAMRALLIAIATTFVAGLATASPVSQRVAVYDHRTNETHYVYRSTDSDFVGASAKTPSAQQKKPSWYTFGHP